MRYDQPFFVGVNNKRFRGVSKDGYLPALGLSDTKDVQPEPIIKPRIICLKIDRGALELNRRVTELENANRYLIRKIKELTAYASKRRPKNYKYKDS